MENLLNFIHPPENENYLTFFATCIDNISFENLSNLFTSDIFFEDYDSELEDQIETNNTEAFDIAKSVLSEILENVIENHQSNMSNNDKKIITFTSSQPSQDLEIIEYTHLNDCLKEKLKIFEISQHLNKSTILHNLNSLSQLKQDQKLWLCGNIKQINVSTSSCMFRWLLGQSRFKIVPCIILTFGSAFHEQYSDDYEIKQSIVDSIKGLDNLMQLYPNLEELKDLKILSLAVKI